MLMLQGFLSLVLLAVTAFFGCLPVYILKKIKKNGQNQSENSLLSYISCFSGGVFMATCFLDVIPHVIDNYNEMVEEFDQRFSIVLWPLFVCGGLFLVYLIEIGTTKVFGSGKSDDAEGGGHGHSHGIPSSSKKKQNARLLEENTPSNNLNVENKLERHHSHAMEDALPWVVSDEKSNMFKSLTFAVAMSFHSLLEGFALGVQDDNTAVWTLFVSLLLHKCIESFSVGLQISRSNEGKSKIVIATILIYSIMTPLGACAGTFLQNYGENTLAKQMTIVILEGMAAGTFIYVTFFEILAPEKFNRFSDWKQFSSILFGFLVITLLQLVFGHEAHGHTHDIVNASVPVPTVNIPLVYPSPAI